MAYPMEQDIYSNLTSYYYWPSFLNNASNYTAYDVVVNDVVGAISHDYQKWVFSITGCLLVGLSGIFPLLIFPNGDCSSLSKNSSGSGVGLTQLRRLLNFAVGSLLGDVFLHLLPEAWNQARESGSSKHDSLMFLGFWVLIGLVSFVICEKLVSGESEPSQDTPDSSNNNVSKISKDYSSEQVESNKHVRY
ncbi:unnamed protein product [Orchesella dallaii]|uniref:Zinc transporter ZIP13 n=1 Tax=Orchesella dallaii TaxID=48710 RepID=A0ABP1PY86_9HEXA